MDAAADIAPSDNEVIAPSDNKVIPPSDAEVIPPSECEVIPPSDAKEVIEVKSDGEDMRVKSPPVYDSQQENQVYITGFSVFDSRAI